MQPAMDPQGKVATVDAGAPHIVEIKVFDVRGCEDPHV